MLLLTLNICSHYSEEVYVRIKQSGVLAQHKILLNQPAPEYKGRAQFDVQLPPWRNSAGNSPVNSEKATGLRFPVSCTLQAWTILLTSGVWNLVMSALNFLYCVIWINVLSLKMWSFPIRKKKKRAKNMVMSRKEFKICVAELWFWSFLPQ